MKKSTFFIAAMLLLLSGGKMSAQLVNISYNENGMFPFGYGITITVDILDTSVTDPFLYIEDSNTHKFHKSWEYCEANRGGFYRTFDDGTTYTFKIDVEVGQYAWFFGLTPFERLTISGIDVFIGYGDGVRANAVQGNQIGIRTDLDNILTGNDAVLAINAKPITNTASVEGVAGIQPVGGPVRDTLNTAMPFVVCFATANPLWIGQPYFCGTYGFSWNTNNISRPLTLIGTQEINNHTVYNYEYLVWDYAELMGKTAAELQTFSNGIDVRNLGISVNSLLPENNGSLVFKYDSQSIIFDSLKFENQNVGLGDITNLQKAAFISTGIQIPENKISYGWEILGTTTNTVDVNGYFTANEAGEFTVQLTANFGEIPNQQIVVKTATITVATEYLDRITLSPVVKTLTEGESFEFTAQAFSGTNIQLNTGISYNYTIEPQSDNELLSYGKFTAYQTGTYTVTCTATQYVDGENDIAKTATASVTVNAFNPAVNLALNKPATASLGDALLGNDGLNTRWRTSQANETNYWQVDLGGLYVVNNVKIVMNGDANAREATYNILVSQNGEEWTTVVTGGQIPSGGGQEFSDHLFTGTVARYVKYDGITKGGWDHNFAEFQVYGTSAYNPNGGIGLNSVTVLPVATVTGYVGDPVNFTSTALNGLGTPIADAEITWSCDPVITDIDVSTGVFIPTQTGLYTITATAVYNDVTKTGSSLVNVSAARIPATVTVEFDHNYIFYGFNESAHFVTTVKDQYNNTMTDYESLTYEVSTGAAPEAGIASGNYICSEAGSVTFKATAERVNFTQSSIIYNFTVFPNPVLDKTSWIATSSTTYGLNPAGAIDGIGNVNNDNYLWRIPNIDDNLLAGTPTDEYLTIDMGKVLSLDMIELLWEGANPRAYKVYAKEETEDWEIIGEQSALPNQQYVYYRNLVDNTKKYRYIKIGDITAGTGYGVKLFEFTAWGKNYYPEIVNVNENTMEVSSSAVIVTGDYFADVYLDIRKGVYDITKVEFVDIGNNEVPDGDDNSEGGTQPAPRQRIAAEVIRTFEGGAMPANNVFNLNNLTPVTPYTFHIIVTATKPSDNDYIIEADITFTTNAEGVITEIPTVILSQISIYPNPATDILYIGGIAEKTAVKIYDSTGHLLKQQQISGEINVSDLQQGIYLLTVGEKVMKFIKR
ncbi:MAG: discoidin domain-containing protein [Prevotellaceae bacterium]|jgi:hypothetical protein|nr:discoidin domain-containing protein [Prevotellaceae bacterium]